MISIRADGRLVTSLTPESLESLREYLTSIGYKIIDNPTLDAKLAEHLSDMPPEILALLDGVAYVFVYRLPPNYRDGVCVSAFSDRDEEVVTIGISDFALEDGKEHTVRVFVHELCHNAIGDYRDGGDLHGVTFQQYLDYLYYVYADKTGLRIANDYQGLSPDLVP